MATYTFEGPYSPDDPIYKPGLRTITLADLSKVRPNDQPKSPSAHVPAAWKPRKARKQK